MKPDAIPSLRKFQELEGKTFLVGVGAAKCGTSWLYRYLKSLPEVTLSPLKEVHFFDQKFTTQETEPTNPMAIRRVDDYFAFDVDLAMTLKKHPHFQASIDRLKMIYDDNAYFDHFARLCTQRTRILGDITPAYAVLGQSGFRYMVGDIHMVKLCKAKPQDVAQNSGSFRQRLLQEAFQALIDGPEMAKGNDREGASEPPVTVIQPVTGGGKGCFKSVIEGNALAKNPVKGGKRGAPRRQAFNRLALAPDSIVSGIRFPAGTIASTGASAGSCRRFSVLRP